MSFGLYRFHVLRKNEAGVPLRFRIILVHCEPWWSQRDLLPDGPGFFVQLLRDAEGPLSKAVTLKQCLDAQWLDDHAHRYVPRVERVATRNLPVGEELADVYLHRYQMLDDLFWSTSTGRCRPDEHQAIEDRLVQADYDVHTSAPQWSQPLVEGQRGHTRAWGPPNAAWAAIHLGNGLWDQGDREHAETAFRRAIVLGDAGDRVQARLHLNDLLAGKGSDHVYELRDDAALAMAIEARAAGREEEAQAAYHLAVQIGGAPVIAEARRRAGLASPAENAYDLVRRGQAAQAAALLRTVYNGGTDTVARFGLALFDGDIDRAVAAMGGGNGDRDLSWCAQVAMDLAFMHARAGDTGTAQTLVDLAESVGFAPFEQFRYAVTSGSAHPPELAGQIGRELVDRFVDPASDDSIDSLVDAVREVLPDLAGYACRAQAECHARADRMDRAAEWFQRQAELDATAPGSLR